MKKIKNILILAGGDNTRFWPLQEKVLFSFLGKPFIKYLIKGYLNYCHNLIIVTNPSIKEKIKQSAENKVKIIIQNPAKPGMAGAVMSCKNLIKGETLIVIATDIFKFEILTQLINKVKQEKKDYIFLAKKVTEYYPGGYLTFNKDKVTGLIEKPNPNDVPSQIIKLVVDYFSDFDLLINSLEKIVTNKDDLYEQAINKLIKEGKKTDHLLYDDYFFPLKYPWHVLSMMNFFLYLIDKQKISSLAKISKKADIIGNVLIENGAKIGDYAKIVGPCYIGKNTIIGDYAMVRESHIGDGCLIGAYSEVTRSYLGNKVFLHRNYVGDSILAEGVLMGAGASTANFRFDGSFIKSLVGEKKINTQRIKLGTIIGKKSKVGVNSTILPGVKIGQDSFIAPGEVVETDIGDKIYLSKTKKITNKFNFRV